MAAFNQKGTGIRGFTKRTEEQFEELRRNQVLKKAAAKGDPSAIYNLALNEKNDARAFKLYQQSAASGHTKAMFNLALMYANGRGTNKSMVRALTCYRQAAAKGYAKAHYNLGLHYEKAGDDLLAKTAYERAVSQSVP